jgi:hypothetical protein
LSEAETELRPREIAVTLPPQSDAAVYFIGFHTPWRTRQECPKRGSLEDRFARLSSTNAGGWH